MNVCEKGTGVNSESAVSKTSRDTIKARVQSWLYLQQVRTLLRDDERRHRLLFGMGLAVVGIVAALAYATYRLRHLPYDLGTTTQLQRIQYGPFADFMVAVSLLGYYPSNVVVISVTCLLVGYWLTWREGTFLAGLTAVQGLANYALKAAIGRPRPAESVVEVLLPTTGHSFPSGHVMLYTVFFGFCFFLVWSNLLRSPWRTLLLIVTGALVLLVGPSRIYLGAHWLSDVVAGHLVGLTFLFFGIEFYAKYVMTPAALRSEE